MKALVLPPTAALGAFTTQVVRITTIGASFAPQLELVGGSAAVASWTVEETGAVVGGLTPTIAFGSAAVRHVRLAVTNNGADAMGDVTTFNLGFDNADDTGFYAMGVAYNKAPEAVSAIENVNVMRNLVRFAATHTPVAGHFDFTGMASLQFIELYGSNVEGVTLNGCVSLRRLTVELGNCPYLDLNPVAATLRDLRAAHMQGGELTFATLTAPMAQQYHQCIRDQRVINRPADTLLPVIMEEWIWNTAQGGAYHSISTMGASLNAHDNAYVSADMAGRAPAFSGSALDMNNNLLTSINLTGCPGFTYIDLSRNAFNQAAIDGIFAVVNGFNTSNGIINLSNNVAPGLAGQGHANALQLRGWAVTCDAPPPAAPTSTAAPAIPAAALIGDILTCTRGLWSGFPTGYTYQWKLDGVPIVGQTTDTYQVVAGDATHNLSCTVTATNATGSTSADSNAVTVSAATGPSTLVFSDDFETGDLSKWNAPETLSGSPLVIATTGASHAHAGTYGLHFSTGAGGAALIRHVDLGWTVYDVLLKFWFRVNTAPAGSTTVVLFRDPGGQSLWEIGYNGASPGQMSLSAYGPSGSVPAITKTTITTGVWHQVEVRVNNAVSGTARFVYDGTTVGSYSGDLSRPNPATQLQFWADGPNTQIAFDDIELYH